MAPYEKNVPNVFNTEAQNLSNNFHFFYFIARPDMKLLSR